MRVLLADDDPEFLRVLGAVISTCPGVELVAIAESGAGAVELARRQRPDIVLMDFAMWDLSGVETTRRLARLPNPPATIMLGEWGTYEHRRAAALAGADTFVVKAEAEAVIPRLLTDYVARM
jgi:SARP family transcriptional regulator, regulator of embCAB operon